MPDCSAKTSYEKVGEKECAGLFTHPCFKPLATVHLVAMGTLDARNSAPGQKFIQCSTRAAIAIDDQHPVIPLAYGFELSFHVDGNALGEHMIHRGNAKQIHLPVVFFNDGSHFAGKRPA